ncbi:MAG: tRNA (guanosine(46)-N7)-methyltransferase TrmB [Candidatus Dojkabacteria bacterium]|nr:MAG: tRNA (guanosine(46)-N7)-methyltransferase TrmB [Candidatus Dojkabacteria bacterium]
MKKSLKTKVKKIKYQTASKLSENVRQIKKSVKASSYKYAAADLDPLNYEQLPWPFPWEKYMDFDHLYVEIGSGHGEQLQKLATENPGNLYVGFEIFKKFALMSHKKVSGLKNALVFKADAYEAAIKLFTDHSLAGVYILFPDPWHKKRHHKRRPLVASWFEQISTKLADGGFIIFATDWEEYFDFVLDQANKVSEIFEVTSGVYRPEEWGFAQTHYYKKWVKQDRRFRYILLKAKSTS